MKQNKQKRLQERALALLQKHTSREEAEEVFHSNKEKKRIAETINAEFARKLEKRLHLDPQLRVLEKDVINTNLAHNLEGLNGQFKSKRCSRVKLRQGFCG